MNEDGRPPRRNRSRRRPDGGSRRVAARPAYARRRPDYATGGYSSIYSGPFPTDQDEQMEPLTLTELQAKPVDELRELANEHGIEGAEEMEHQDLVLKLLDAVPLAPARSRIEQNGQPGIAERRSSRSSTRASGSFAARHHAVARRRLVSSSQVRRFGLRTGDKVTRQTRPPKDQEKYWGLLRVDTVNGVDPETAKRRPYFDTLVPVFRQVVALPHAHLASAVRRSGRPSRAADHGARGERDRHAHRRGARRDTASRAPCRSSRRTTRGIRATSTTCRCTRTSRVVDGDAGRQLRHAAHVDGRPTCRATTRSCARRRSTSSPWAEGKWSAARRRRTTWSPPTSRRSTTPRSSRASCSTIATSRRGTRSSSSARARRTPTSSRRRSTIPSRRSSCCAAWRSWACTSSSSTAT